MARIDGRRLERELPGRQGQLLLAYLVCTRPRAVPRDELVELLWGERPPAATDAGLSALVSKLRKLLGPERLVGRSELQLLLAPDTIVDVADAVDMLHLAESALAAGEPKRAYGCALTAAYIAERPFLPGHDGEWVTERRRALQDVATRALECFGRATLSIGNAELPGAERAARKVVALAPYRESACLLLMDVLVAQGNSAEAVLAYNELRVRLRDDLGLAPSGELQARHERLLGATSR